MASAFEIMKDGHRRNDPGRVAKGRASFFLDEGYTFFHVPLLLTQRS